MNFNILYQNSDKCKLKEDLIYFYPKQKRIINKLVDKIECNESIVIKDDKIIKNEYSNSYAIDDYDFIRCMYILKNINENTKIIYIDSLNEHNLLKLYYKLNVFDYCCYYVIIDNVGLHLSVKLLHLFSIIIKQLISKHLFEVLN